MTQPSLFRPQVHPIQRFDGVTYDPAVDGPRLSEHLARVERLMADGQWRTLSQIADAIGCSVPGASARVRDLRKRRNGSHQVDRRRVDGSGLFEYRVR